MYDTAPLDSSAIYRSIFHDCEAFVYRCHNDTDFTMQFMDGQVAEICGYRADQIIGNAEVSFVGLTHPDDQQMMFDAVDAAIEGDKPWNVTYRLISASGAPVWIKERGAAVRDETGKVVFLQGLIVNATAEVALRDQIHDIESKTDATNKELLQLSSRIVESIRSLSFLAVNARIEAARAGDSGRGFAVIAGDISALVNDNSQWIADLSTILSQQKT